MGLLKELTNALTGPFGRKSNDLALVDTNNSAWERWGLRRSSSRIRYNEDSAFTAYRNHELVFACINKIADVMNDAEIVVEVKNAKGEWEKRPGHLLQALFKRPNTFQTGRDVRRLMVQSEQGLGKFIAHIERSGAGIPVGLTVLNPNRVKPKYDRDNSTILYYEYLKSNGKRTPLKIEDLLIRRRADLLDQFGGFAPLQAALKSINSDLGLTDYVDAFFESDGTPSGILKILNSTVPETKREALQAQWKQKYGRGGANQKGIAVLDQNAEFQRIGSNLDELASDSLSGRHEARICAVFGVPPNLVGAYVGLLHVTANATAKAELQNFWDNKISGELSVLREWLTWFVLPEFEDIEAIKAEKIRVGWDISHVAFLQEDVEKIHERARKNLQAGGITVNEFRQAISLAPDPAGDYYLQPINVTELSPENRAARAIEKIPAGTDPTTSPKYQDWWAEEAVMEAFWRDLMARYGGKTDLLPADTLEKKTFDHDGLTLGREPRGVELVIDLKKIVADYDSERTRIAGILSRFRAKLIDQAADSLDSLDPKTAHTLTLTPDPKIRKELYKALESAYKAGRSQIIAEIAAQEKAKGLNLSPETKSDIEDYLKWLDELTDGLISRVINEITTRAVNQYLMLKLLNDYVVEKLRQALLDQSEKFIDGVSGSTVNAAISQGRDDEIKDQGDNVEYTEYSAILDQNTCGPCGDADGLTEKDPLDLPAAPNPECEGGDRCRCIHVAVIA
jgi:HK97 family phage portal protein